jgi:hypothetical protein
MRRRRGRDPSAAFGSRPEAGEAELGYAAEAAAAALGWIAGALPSKPVVLTPQTRQ